MQKVFVVLLILCSCSYQTRKVSRDSGDAKVETRVNTSRWNGYVVKSKSDKGMVLNHKHDWQFVQFPKEFMDMFNEEDTIK
mgnify:CR=1 FL=1|jgi:hypothetical protein